MIVHIHGGSVVLENIANAGIEGDALEWCDVLVFGPTPRLEGHDWYDVRARALEELCGEAGPYRERLEAQDRALSAIDSDAEIVLWFGPELFCQTILVALLAKLADRPRVSLISPGDLPGKPRGCTVSYLSKDELHAAFSVRAPVTPAQTQLARVTWDAWRAGDQRIALNALLSEDLSALPHLRQALMRWLAEPVRTDQLIESSVRKGLKDWREIFRDVQLAEARPWLTDTLFLHRLAKKGLPSNPTAAPDKD